VLKQRLNDVGNLGLPVRDRTVTRRCGVVTCALALVLLSGWRMGMPTVVPNSTEYVEVAKGHAESVARPFSSRLLHPWTAMALMRSGLSLENAFTAVAWAALGVLVACTAGTVFGFGGVRWAWPLLLWCPILVEYFCAAYMPDLFHAALLAGLWLALMRAEPLAYPILVALLLCRESSVLAVFVVTLYFLWRQRYWQAAGAVVAAVFGMVLVGLVAPAGSQNIHHFSTGSYIALKSVWNFLSNWLGLRLWQPAFALQSVSPWGCPNPLLTVRLLGVSSPLVVCDWRPETIVATWTNFFGVMSISCAFLAAGWRALYAGRNERRCQVALAIGVYGLLAGVVGTFTGTATYRLVGYGWPLLWIAVPVLFLTVFRDAHPGWLWLHWAGQWAWLLVSQAGIGWMVLFCLVMIGLNVWTWRRLRGAARMPELALDDALGSRGMVTQK